MRILEARFQGLWRQNFEDSGSGILRILEARFQGLWGQNFEDSGSGILRILEADFGDFEDRDLENFGDLGQLGDSKSVRVFNTCHISFPCFYQNKVVLRSFGEK